MKINVNFHYHISPCHLKNVTFLRYQKEVRKQKFTSTSTCSGQEGLIIQNKMLKLRKAVIILKSFKFRYNLDFCSKKCVKKLR